ncbi:MAG: nitroreductase family protein [Candidatus Sumerlaeota bacterium]
MKFHDLVHKRRSVRKFNPSEIDEEALVRIVEAGRVAPSGMNVQDREFIIIQDKDILEQLEAKVQKGFANAAAAVGIIMKPEGTDYWKEDAAAAAQNMLLAIVEEGYDSVWVEGTLLRQEAWARDMLSIPDDRRLYVLLPIGKPASEDATQAPKAELKDILHWDKYRA